MKARDDAVGWGTALKIRKVAGSEPEGVTDNFRWLNPASYGPRADSPSDRNEYQEW